MAQQVRAVGPAALTAADGSPGVTRAEALRADGLWSGLARTDPGVVSGWHHHGDHDTVLYVVRGAIAVQTADGTVGGGPGTFLHVPAHVVHREGNPSAEPAEVVLVRRGHGPLVVDVAGAGPADAPGADVVASAEPPRAP